MGAEFYIAAVSLFVIGIIAGGGIVLFYRRMVFNRQLRAAQRKAARTVAEARTEAQTIMNEAKEESDKVRVTASSEYRERRSELQRQENRLTSKSETLERRIEGVEQRCGEWVKVLQRVVEEAIPSGKRTKKRR